MIVNTYSRYQAGLTLNNLFPAIKGKCACGCGKELPKSRKKWYSDLCRDTAFIKFAIIKGDTSIIRHQLFLIDMGACRMCGSVTDTWQADHIIPVMYGGSGCDLSNLQTLCIECHQSKTFSHSKYYPILIQFPRKRPQFSLSGLSLKVDRLQIAV